MSRRYWIGVASRDHVRRGLAGGFAQLCHGKAAPLRRMAAGDGLIYYSPVLSLEGREPCQRFTAVGLVADARVYPFRVSADFEPYRRDIAFCRPRTPRSGRCSASCPSSPTRRAGATPSASATWKSAAPISC